jgi:DNA-directed RNA polymerase subunit L
MTTNNLTEQWKKGELPTGDYYVKPKNGQVFVYHINHSVKHIYHNHAGEIKEVLAPVPSYIELQAKDSAIEQLEALNTANDYLIKLLEEQNQKLKELLKECRNWLKSYRDTHSSIKDDVNETICKINEVLK